jgi:hypothetical protein
MGGGGGGKTVYKAPEPDRSFEKFLQYQMQRDQAADARLLKEEADRKAAEAARTAAATQNLGSLYSNLESQLRSGLISYADATSQLQGYAGMYDLDPGSTFGYGTDLANIYTSEIQPGRRATGVEAAYEELLGRSATEEEKQKAMERFGQGYYSTVQDFKDSLVKSQEYQDKFNQSYLDNYYDTQFGKQTVDEEGKKTGKRTFKFSQEFMPSFIGDLKDQSGLQMPEFGDFTGTPAELEEFQQSMRQSRQYLYSAGLTNLQGEIDKELQNIKMEGTKEITRVSKEGDLYSSLVGAFSFS